MTKIKLTDGTIINASTVEVVYGTLKITTTEYTVEELAEIFRLRYVLGLNFHTIMCVLYRNARSESTARKKISRFFEKGLV
jgi:hypothetical protein